VYIELVSFAADNFLDVKFVTQIVIDSQIPLFINVEYYDEKISDLDANFISNMSGYHVDIKAHKNISGKVIGCIPEHKKIESKSELKVESLKEGFYEIVRQRGDKKELKVIESIYNRSPSLCGVSFIRSVDSNKNYTMLKIPKTPYVDFPVKMLCIREQDYDLLVEKVDFISRLNITLKKLLPNKTDVEIDAIETVIRFVSSFIESQSKKQIHPKELTEESNFSMIEREKMLAVILGIAVDKYGYSPSRKRNTATGGNRESMNASIERAGLKVHPDTIRGYLKDGMDIHGDKIQKPKR